MRVLTLFLFVFMQSFFAFATQETPQSFTFDGRAYSDSAGTTPLLDASVLFKIQILNPAQDCVLYEEQQTLSTLISNGYFNISVGSAASDAKRTVGGGALDSNNEMNLIFSNTQASVSGKKLSDASACTYTPASGDKKYLRLQMTPSSDGVTRTLSPLMAFDSVPSAVVAERAESLQGLAPSQLLQTNSGGGVALTQANLESVFSATNYTRLSTLVSVPPANYVQTGANGSATIPSVAGNPGSGLTNGQIWYDSGSNSLKYYNGSVQVLGSGSGTVSSVTGTSPISVASGTSTPVISITKADTSTNGYLSSADWTTFNNKLSSVTSTDVTTALGYTPANNSASWSTDGTHVYRTTGNVGIGTTTPKFSTGSLTRYFAVNNSLDNEWSEVGAGGSGTGNFATLGYFAFFNSSLSSADKRNAMIRGMNDGATNSGNISFLTSNAGVLAEKMRIDKSGNVGVGTTAPILNLNVSGTNNTTLTSTSFWNLTFPGALIENRSDTANSVAGLVFANGSARNAVSGIGGIEESTTLGALGFFTGGFGAGFASPERMRITSAGNVGIGTTSPQTTLQVAGVISPATNNTYTLGNATYRFTEVYATNGVINTSDRREKKDIYNTDLGLDFINKLRPVSYRWNTGVDNDVHYGLIAQEAEQVIAEVGKTEKTSIVTHDETTDRYGVRYSELISPLIKAVQELYNRLMGVEAHQSTQDREIASVKAENAELKAKVQKTEQENAAKAKEMTELKARLDKIEKALKSK